MAKIEKYSKKLSNFAKQINLHMKKNSFLLLISLFIFSAVIAQDEDMDGAPMNVEKAFKKMFPKAVLTSWEIDEDDNWEASFKMAGKKQSASFNEDGEWIETETVISQKEIPQMVLASLNKNYPKHKITAAELVENSDGKWYEVEFDRGGSKYEVMFDAKGEIVNEEAEEEPDMDYEIEEEDMD